MFLRSDMMWVGHLWAFFKTLKDYLKWNLYTRILVFLNRRQYANEVWSKSLPEPFRALISPPMIKYEHCRSTKAKWDPLRVFKNPLWALTSPPKPFWVLSKPSRAFLRTWSALRTICDWHLALLSSLEPQSAWLSLLRTLVSLSKPMRGLRWLFWTL